MSADFMSSLVRAHAYHVQMAQMYDDWANQEEYKLGPEFGKNLEIALAHKTCAETLHHLIVGYAKEHE